MTKFFLDRSGIGLAINDGIVNGLNQVALDVSKIVRKELSKRGTGRVYRVAQGKKNGRNMRAKGLHRASAPGQPPAVVTNRLRASWTISGQQGQAFSESPDTVLKVEKLGSKTVMVFGSNVLYARFLEFGTRRMASRPYIRPVFAAVRPNIPTIIRKEIGRSIQAGVRGKLFKGPA